MGFWIAAAAFALLLAGAAWWMTAMPGRSHAGALEPPDDDLRALAARLRADVTAIASREHNLHHAQAYEAAASYIERQLGAAGYAVQRQVFETPAGASRNIEVEIRGSREGTMVVGAHYDSVGGAPGANDNGSGVAAVLELARRLRAWNPAHTWKLVLFANEEPPYFHSDLMGSAHYAQRAKARGERIEAMFSLETLGYYSDQPGSQRYPWPFNFFYPDRGNFVGFVGNLASRELLHRAIRAFRTHARFPSDGLAAPAFIPGVDWSDHWNFWRQGWPALMITDTAPYRYPHYHTAGDTPDKVDYERLARVVRGLEATFRELDR